MPILKYIMMILAAGIAMWFAIFCIEIIFGVIGLFIKGAIVAVVLFAMVALIKGWNKK